ncbi:monovalent cation/H(+) antiporter subunit G [Aureimonas sp. Leaf324]|jgi:multicomponent Na+:H+ antiporter subunit G|uniref:monovalent cation/H(+) antiporter subunit G n=1 Tax=Aureimonas sp. Leaf324 TaxID=1736336 RepID=UPI0006FA11D0|nr:monovalent cation/H(+) antiporter subunit G [Aureimonas sp. Leaf324]KQQ81821.1 cation:proton antiporter [Aureimonas sp. Leaf324]
MTAMGNLLAALFVILGALFALVASVGILRLPDFYTRVHAASKAGTVGSALALVALAIVSVQTAEVLRAIAAIVFFFLTAPIAAHLLGKAAYSAGYRMWSGSVLDEMQARKPATEEGDGGASQRPIL